MKNGHFKRGTRAKAGALETIDNVTKFALSDEDYEEYEEWVEYTENELAEIKAAELEAAKKLEQEAFLLDAPERLSVAEGCITALISAFGEVE